MSNKKLILNHLTLFFIGYSRFFVVIIQFKFAKVLNFGKLLTDITFNFITKILL